MNTQINLNQDDQIEIITPQDCHQFQKLPIHIIKWQPYLNPYQFSVLTYITSRIHKDKHYAYPSLTTAAEDCNISENTFTKSIQKLEQIGLIFVDRSNRSNRYYLTSPIEPNLENISKHFPKLIEKFKYRNQKKIISINNYPSTSSHKLTSSGHESQSPHQMRSNLNLTNSNLKNQQHSEIRNDVVERAPNKFSPKDNIINLDKVQFFKDIGIKSYKIPSLIKNLNPLINLKEFKQYVFRQVIHQDNIKNKAGFFIHAINHLQNDYLEFKSNQKKSYSIKQSQKDLMQKLKELKDHISEISLKKWSEMGNDEKDNIKQIVQNEHKGFNFKEETLELFYIDNIRKSCLEISNEDIGFIDSLCDTNIITHQDQFIRLYEKYILI